MKATLLLIAVFFFGSAEQADSQWIQSKGSLRESVSALTISGTNLLAGTFERGLYLSTDSGTSWSKLDSYNLDNKTIHAIVISNSNFVVGTDNGIYVSTNNGASWTRGTITVAVNTLIVSGTTLLAGTNDGVYLSTNGINWATTSLSTVGISSLVVSGANIYAGSGYGIFRSTDNGKNWTQTNFPSSGGVDRVTSLAVLGMYLFAVPHSSGVIFRSTDNGTTWNIIDSTLTNDITSLAVSDSNLFAGTDSGLFVSTNYCQSWNLVKDSFFVGAVGVLGSNLFVGTLTGVFRSTNYGSTWTQDNELPLNSAVFALDLLGKNIIAGTYRSNTNEDGGGVFFSSDYGINWTPTSLNHETVLALSVLGTNLFVGTDSGVFLSTDNARNWTQVGLTHRHINTFAVLGSDIFACTDSGLFLSTDNGANWTLKGFKNIQVNAFTILDTTLCVGTNEGIFVSIDNSKSWVQTGLTATTISSLAVLGTNLFAGTRYTIGGIYLSTDNGFNWHTVNTGLSNNGNINALSLAVSGTNLFIGTVSYGVFLSADTGRSWKNVGLGFDEHALAILGTEIYAGTYGRSVWRRPLSEMISSEVKIHTDTHVTLAQNIPNPFDKVTKIRFELERSAFVSLKILDILGREVSVLASEELPAGLYTRDWNASAFPPGEYFCRLQTGAYSETNKLILVR